MMRIKWLAAAAVSCLAAAPALAQNQPFSGRGRPQPNVYLDITPQPKDPCEDAYKNRSSVTIRGARPPAVSNAPNAHIPADGTMGCDLPLYAPPAVIEPELPPK